MPGIDDYVNSLRQDSGQRQEQQLTNSGKFKNLYPAIVVQEKDVLEQGRIVARIVNLDNNGNVVPGRDKNIPDNRLPFAVPLSPGFLHYRPLPGEMVILLIENPSDITSPRYWVGPIITSPLKLSFQSFRESAQVFDKTDFNQNQKLKARLEPSLNLPGRADVALQGRDDARVILRPREIYMAAGIFRKDELKANTETPCTLRMRQIENQGEDVDLKNISSTELTSTVINLFSPRGKFREEQLSQFENNEDLKDLGELANQLHPAVFGDELVKLLDLIIRVLLNHIHTPQKPLATTADSKTLSRYNVDGELQKIISNHIRLN